MIAFLCPMSDSPSGGIWLIHRLAGMVPDAKVVQSSPFSVHWDAHPEKQGEVLHGPLVDSPDNTLIVPEIMWGDFGYAPMILPMSKKILFVQNHLWLDNRFDLRGVQAWVCSRYLANYLRRVHGISSNKITPFLDEDTWQASQKREQTVLVMARRNPYYDKMIEALYQNGFLVTAIHQPLNQAHLAQYLGESDYYVHLSHPEGFPMACLEAMRSKAVVVGTTGGGGNEFLFHRQTAWCVQDSDNGHYENGDEFVSRIIEGLTFLRNDPKEREKIRDRAYDWSLRYTENHTAVELMAALL